MAGYRLIVSRSIVLSPVTAPERGVVVSVDIDGGGVVVVSAGLSSYLSLHASAETAMAIRIPQRFM